MSVRARFYRVRSADLPDRAKGERRCLATRREVASACMPATAKPGIETCSATLVRMRGLSRGIRFVRWKAMPLPPLAVFNDLAVGCGRAQP